MHLLQGFFHLLDILQGPCIMRTILKFEQATHPYSFNINTRRSSALDMAEPRYRVFFCPTVWSFYSHFEGLREGH